MSGMSFLVLTACGGGGGAEMGSESHMQRHETMEALGDAILPLNQMAQGEMPVDEAVFLEQARSLAASSADVFVGFDDQTQDEHSRAKPEIWDNWDDFVAKGEALQTAATALLEAAESGGSAAGIPLVRGVRDTCGGCHRPYRAPED